MHFLFFSSLLLATCVYALWRGDRDHKTVALLCLSASLLSHLLAKPYVYRFTGVETGIMAVDVGTLIGFVLVALGSSRFWPMWIAGLQLTTNLAHFAMTLDLSLIPKAYGVAAAFWSYPILLILAVGTWRAHQRRGDEPWDSQHAS